VKQPVSFHLRLEAKLAEPGKREYSTKGTVSPEVGMKTDKKIRVLSFTAPGNTPGNTERLSCRKVGTQEDFEHALNMTQPDLVILQEDIFSGDLLQFISESRRNFSYPIIMIRGDQGLRRSIELIDAGAMDCISADHLTPPGFACIIHRVVRDWNITVQGRPFAHPQNESDARQRQLSKLEALGRLAGGVAHDFNNIIMVINGFTTLLEKKIHPNIEEFSYLMEIKKAGHKAADLTRQLLAFSRKQPLTIVPADLNQIISEAIKMLTRLIGEDIIIETKLDPSLSMINGDISQIDQIIINLSTNARDAMPEGGTLTFETKNVPANEIRTGRFKMIKPGDYVLLRVTDTGFGMEPEILSSIFEPFSTTKAPTKGTGLGLATVYGTIKQIGGYIFCESHLGKGTVFSIYFPCSREQKAVPGEEINFAPSSFHGNETILLAEDKQMVRTVIRRNLEEYGYTLLEARNGMEAFSIIRSGKYKIDLLITDVIMPEKSGVELAYELDRMDSGMKVLFISGYNERLIENLKGLSLKWRLLQKPIKNELLIYTIRSLIESSDPHTAGTESI